MHHIEQLLVSTDGLQCIAPGFGYSTGLALMTPVRELHVRCILGHLGLLDSQDEFIDESIDYAHRIGSANRPESGVIQFDYQTKGLSDHSNG